MNRRDLIKKASLGLLGAGAVAFGVKPAAAKETVHVTVHLTDKQISDAVVREFNGHKIRDVLASSAL